jgi:hypothetical protein
MRYYFDLRDGDEVTPDEEGLEFASIERVQEEAARSLTDMARDSMRRRAAGSAHRMAIEVRDHQGPVLQALLTFEVKHGRR